jgi:hypothetical protein
MNPLTRLEEYESTWSCGRGFGTTEVGFQERATQEMTENIQPQCSARERPDPGRLGIC